MLTLSFTFPGGRYHATPWGRHVNEADLEWPPSPWRIARALIAVWHRKLAPEQRDAELLTRVLGKLAQEAPHYRIPEAVHAHTRHYMPVKSDKKTLIFDAFVRLSADEAILASWPAVQLDEKETALLDCLLDRLGFLGRAESWADAVRLSESSVGYNCVPGESHIDESTGKIHERVKLLMPMGLEEYSAFAGVQNKALLKRGDLTARQKKAIKGTLPESWLDAVSQDTSDLRAAGWSAPPAARSVTYVRPAGLLGPIGRVGKRSTELPSVTTFRFAMYGKPLPRIEDAVRVGECLRVAVMSRIKDECEGIIPSVISGHGLSEDNRHAHAFWLAEDLDEDGHIDHVLIHVLAGVSGTVRAAIESLRRLWNRDGQRWQLILEGAGSSATFAQSGRRGRSLCSRGVIFESVTPYLMPWHKKTNFDLNAQIRRECLMRGYVEPVCIEVLPKIQVAGRARRPLDFYRFRSKQGLVQPDRRGSFVRLVFPSAVQGPLALGYGCHFGLGMFAARTDITGEEGRIEQ